MRDRSLAIIFTVIAILLLGCPGVTIFCLGITGFIVYYSAPNNNGSPALVNILGSSGICVGILLIIITIVLAFFLLRRKADTLPTNLDNPLPPTLPSESIPPSPPDEPILPSPPDEPLPPSI